MAVRQLKDGRWICYYRSRDEDGESRQVWEYFGDKPALRIDHRVMDNYVKARLNAGTGPIIHYRSNPVRSVNRAW